MARILVVEDEQELGDLVTRELQLAGHDVLRAGDGPAAVAEAERNSPDLILLDVMLPGFDGLEVTRRVRRTMATPILMLTARGTELDKVLGLELGADDYLTKPFSMREMLARVHAVLRRVQLIKARSEQASADTTMTFDNLMVDPVSYTVTSMGSDISLTATEFNLLKILAANPRRVFSREYLLEEVWGDDAVVFDRTIDSHIQRLRKKLGGPGTPGDYIETVWGVGYRFVPRGTA